MLSLDIGCGEEKRGDIGIDLKITSQVDVVADAHYLPFKTGIFDKCYALASLEQVDNPLLVLKEIKRILNENGELEILVPTDSRLRSDYVALILSLHLKHLLHEYNAMKSGEHKWQYLKEFLKTLLADLGFQVNSVNKPAYPFITGRRVGKILKKMKLLRFPHLVVQATKIASKQIVTESVTETPEEILVAAH